MQTLSAFSWTGNYLCSVLGNNPWPILNTQGSICEWFGPTYIDKQDSADLFRFQTVGHSDFEWCSKMKPFFKRATFNLLKSEHVRNSSSYCISGKSLCSLYHRPLILQTSLPILSWTSLPPSLSVSLSLSMTGRLLCQLKQNEGQFDKSFWCFIRFWKSDLSKMLLGGDVLAIPQSKKKKNYMLTRLISSMSLLKRPNSVHWLLWYPYRPNVCGRHLCFSTETCNGMLRHSYEGEVIFISLQTYIAPVLV